MMTKFLTVLTSEAFILVHNSKNGSPYNSPMAVCTSKGPDEDSLNFKQLTLGALTSVFNNTASLLTFATEADAELYAEQVEKAAKESGDSAFGKGQKSTDYIGLMVRPVTMTVKI